MGICDKCQIKLEKEEASAVNLRDSYPTVDSWCDVRYLNTKWRCPKGCPTADGEDGEEVIDHGYVGVEDTIEYYCYHCEHSEKYKIKLQLIAGQ